MTPITAVFIVFAGEILQLWLGPEFAIHSSATMRLVALLFFINAFAYIPYTSVQALGRPEVKAILDLLILPIYVGLCWWCMRIMGVNGAALAKLVVTALDCLVLFCFAWKMKAFPLPGLCIRAAIPGIHRERRACSSSSI